MTRTIAGVFFVGMLFAAASSVRAADAAKPKEDWKNDPSHQARHLVAQAADRALEKNAVDKTLELVNKKDRERIEKGITPGDEKAYQEAADKVQAMWKEKYGKRFDAAMHVNDLKDYTVDFTGKGKDEKAVVHMPPEPGEPAYDLHLMKESNGFWRFELPDTVDGKNFYSSLKDSLQKLVDQKTKLTGDADKAYERAVAWLAHEMAFPATAAPAPAAPATK